MRLFRPNRGIAQEVFVQDVDKSGYVLLKFSCPLPPFEMADLLPLETIDGHCCWVSYVELVGDPEFFKGGNDAEWSKVVTTRIHDGKGSKFLPVFNYISISPARPAQNSSDFTTCNMKGSSSKKKHNDTPHRTKTGGASKTKIKIGINGFGRIARTMIKLALESQYVDLVAINDPLSDTKSTCTFSYPNPHQGWRTDFKMIGPDTIVFNENEVTLFKIKEHHKVPWNKTAAEYIIKSMDYDYDNDPGKVRATKYANYRPIDNPYQNRLSPLPEVFQDMFGAVEDVSTDVRAPALLRITPESYEAAQAIKKVLPHWKGMLCGSIFKVPTVDAKPVNMCIEIDQYVRYGLIPSSTRPSDRFDALLGWCVEMIRQIPEVVLCELILE